DELARGLTLVARCDGPPLHIVPGLLQQSALPNVMRGEESQVLGVLADLALPADAQVLIGLPGTHSKWVRARQGRIEQFHTFMTGEVFAALRGHTILGKTMQAAAAPDDDAFARGLEVARGSDAALGLLSHIFSTRTLGLTGALAPTAQADYLSGLLIGHEVASLVRAQDRTQTTPQTLVLCGEPDLCHRYAIALQTYGFAAPTIATQATATGLWEIALAAGLVVAPGPSSSPPKTAGN
ncbi:MAG: 2-dehydro-3-deoxygalactonokinase, partial [Gammaproteobacteria bacterium]|nr:2-dehydro-3-deoxygalactonokinase [Gammaproteobacteria bacterium]